MNFMDLLVVRQDKRSRDAQNMIIDECSGQWYDTSPSIFGLIIMNGRVYWRNRSRIPVA